MRTQTALIGIGANLPAHDVEMADVVGGMAEVLAFMGKVTLSPLYDSPAWPDPSGPPYVNAVARVDTPHDKSHFLLVCQAVERAYGRVRDPADRNAPRPLDLDILAFGDVVSDEEALTLPHPRLADRDFVLAPLSDVAPDWCHPNSGLTAADMLAALPNRTATRR